ncbi:SusF/SusE family outer membrane protein [Winogradskyella eximia]|uniref:SusF/SusE family outer membrane protein n=1 Tax=Winogradskyella eximia TaxID=262006 RepID=UPI002492F6AF|nr:SusE domain-containing protein [Winogradskyella eximia]
MKFIKKLKYVMLALGVLTFTTSCEEDPEFFASESTQITLEELPINQIIIDGGNLDNPALTFNWNNGDFNQAVVENYSVVFSDNPDFTDPKEATSAVGVSSVTMTMGALNTATTLIGLPPLEENTVYARVVASIGVQNELAVSSNVINFQVTPSFNYGFNDYYLVGNGTSADWNNNNNNPPLFRNPGNENQFTYTGYFTKGGGGFDDGRFKILEQRGEWQPQWGTAANEGSDDIVEAGDIAGNPTTQDSDPGRFGIPADGYYTFTINFSSQTYTTTPFDASGAADYSNITIQGSAINSDTTLTQSSFDSHLWYINSVNLQSGDLQFVTNTGATWAGSTSFSGVATDGGDPIPVVVQDDYEVWFNDLTGDYIMIPLNL